MGTGGTGGDELARRASFATSPTATPAAGKAAVRRDLAVHKREALSAAQAAAAEIEHIKAVTEAAFPTMKKVADEKQSASQLSAEHKAETDDVFPKRFAKQEAQGKHLMAKTVARVQKAQSELFGSLKARRSLNGVIKQADRVAAVQHRMAQQEKRARLAVKKQKALAQQHRAASGGQPRKGVAPNSWMTRKAQQEMRKTGLPAAAGGKGAAKPAAPQGRKPISSDFAVSSDGTNVAFLGASQAGDKWFHASQSARKGASAKDDSSKH